jgi:chemotaxis protein methyltransferase CheR
MVKEGRVHDSLLARAAEVISEYTGLYFPKDRLKDLERGLRSAASEQNFVDPEEFIRGIIFSNFTKSQIETLAGHLTVGETYFFRDKKVFGLLEEKVLPELIESRRTTGKYLRIWSAGCCTGEEPYSIAILLNQLLGQAADWNITILATDINSIFLRKAALGIYGEWSFRDIPNRVRERYFVKTKDNHFALLHKIRKRVSFAYHNLAENTYPSPLNNTNAMDLILCRNVLMYLAPDHQSRIIRKLEQCLISGGWLILSPSESHEALSLNFQNLKFKEGIFYRKKRSMDDGQWTKGLLIDDLPLSIEKQKLSSVNDVQSTIINQQSSIQRSPTLNHQSNDHPSSVIERLSNEKQTPSVPGVVQSSIHLARSSADKGRLSEALDHCDKVISADRCNPEYYYLRASILQEQGRLPEAISDLRKALYLDQDFIPAHILLGNLTLRQGSKRGSSRNFRNALNLLSRRPREEVISGAEGLTAGRLIEMIRATRGDLGIDGG